MAKYFVPIALASPLSAEWEHLVSDRFHDCALRMRATGMATTRSSTQPSSSPVAGPRSRRAESRRCLRRSLAAQVGGGLPGGSPLPRSDLGDHASEQRRQAARSGRALIGNGLMQ